VLGARIRVVGDPILSRERSLLVCNHRTRLDWNWLWAALFHGGWPNAGHSAKIVLKDDVKCIPGLGWIMQMSRYLYIRRNWREDQRRMRDMSRYWAGRDSDSGLTAILFPEGTDLTRESIAASNEFAKKNNLKPLKRLLQPRTTGFSFLFEQMKESESSINFTCLKVALDECLDAVYDVTVAYKGQIVQTEKELMEKSPEEICFHIKR